MANSFAAQDRVYSDGQNNKEPVPEEIIEFGFVPPVRMPDGSISPGNKLAANHLNTLLNELYSKISALEARVATLEGA
ncbi:TPA: phosphoglycolate phosphatase [Serratia marcescens]